MLCSMPYVPNLYAYDVSRDCEFERWCKDQPVTHRETLIFPFIAEDILEDVFIFGYMCPIHAIVPREIRQLSRVISIRCA